MIIEFTKQAQKEFIKLEKTVQKQIASAIRKVEAGEVIPKKLTNVEKWKVRVGDYRIILEVYFENDKAYVVRVQHRREFYK